jgi:hypothetical protein
VTLDARGQQLTIERLQETIGQQPVIIAEKDAEIRRLHGRIEDLERRLDGPGGSGEPAAPKRARFRTRSSRFPRLVADISEFRLHRVQCARGATTCAELPVGHPTG